MITTSTLSPSAVEVLGQMFVSGPVWDGNICSKQGRGELYQLGLCDRYNGFAFLTREGVQLAVDWNYTDTKRWSERWYKKQNGA